MLLRILFFCLCLSFLNGEEAGELAAAGRFGEAAENYRADGRQGLHEGKKGDAFRGFFNASMCFKMSGDLGLAQLMLGQAREVGADEGEDESWAVRLDAQEGSIRALGKKPLEAGPFLKRAEMGARRLGLEELLAEIHNDLGISLVSAGRYANGLRWFVSANDFAVRTKQEGLAMRTLHNHLIASFQLWKEVGDRVDRIRELDGFVGAGLAGELEERARGFERAFEKALDVLDGGEASYLGVVYAHSAGVAAWRYGWQKRGFLAVQGALEAARLLSDRGLERDCLLSLLEFYLDQDRALECEVFFDEYESTEGEENMVQKAKISLLRARCLRDRGAGRDQVRRALEIAVERVEEIRSDLARSQRISDFGRSFRERAGLPYLLLADLYLSQEDASEADFNRAREAIEGFKSWELEDFYRDDCVNLTLKNQRDLSDLNDPSIGVLYVIPLPDRTEILLGSMKGTRRWRSELDAESIYRLARVFRHQLEADYGTPRFGETSRKLFDELIGPGLKGMKEDGLSHLVFVPDGPLGNIPLGAFCDPATGRYLIEDFSISISPGLRLTSGEAGFGEVPVGVVAGCSDFEVPFFDLPGVRKEVSDLAGMYGSDLKLIDEGFKVAALRQVMLEREVSVVHIATHGEFNGAAEGTYLLASGNEKLSLDDLELMIRPKKFRGRALDLLCLSACRTAAGDDQAALGFAGSAVKSGSRSVVATLWYIDDGASSEIVTAFHRGYLDGKSKAEALQLAQVNYLRAQGVDGNRHPHFWAPFVLIGEWK